MTPPLPFRALLAPETPNAGGRWSLTIEVGGAGMPDLPDLRGLTVRLLDDSGQPLAELEFSYFDGKVNRSREATLRAPEREGRYAYTLDFPEQKKGSRTHPASQTALEVEVVRNPIRPSAWQLPIGHTAGEPARVMVGAKGGNPGDLAGQRFEVLDAAGATIAEGTFGTEPRAGTEGLYAAEATLPTPTEPGVARYTLRVPPFEAPLPHNEGRLDFSFPTTAAPQHEVVVSVFDHESREPLTGAELVMHPFRATSDGAGVARLRVTEGSHTLFVSKSGYEVYKAPLDVSSDVAHSAELVVEVEPDIGDRYG